MPEKIEYKIEKWQITKNSGKSDSLITRNRITRDNRPRVGRIWNPIYISNLHQIHIYERAIVPCRHLLFLPNAHAIRVVNRKCETLNLNLTFPECIIEIILNCINYYTCVRIGAKTHVCDTSRLSAKRNVPYSVFRQNVLVKRTSTNVLEKLIVSQIRYIYTFFFSFIKFLFSRKRNKCTAIN